MLNESRLLFKSLSSGTVNTNSNSLLIHSVVIEEHIPLSAFLHPSLSSSLWAWIMEVAAWLHCSTLISVRTLLIKSWRQLFNKVGISPALSALFSFCHAAVEVMCASQIFMKDPGSMLSHSSSERDRDRFFKCLTCENSITDFPLDDHIRLCGREWRHTKCFATIWKKRWYIWKYCDSVHPSINYLKVAETDCSLTLFWDVQYTICKAKLVSRGGLQLWTGHHGQMSPSYYFIRNAVILFLQTYKRNLDLEWIANFHDSSIMCQRKKMSVPACVHHLL